tara:strand:+ start:1083 stop:1334 length:252 start_codon:yes stop_codon:yes gene_type:complete
MKGMEMHELLAQAMIWGDKDFKKKILDKMDKRIKEYSKEVFTIQDMLKCWNEALNFNETRKYFPDVIKEIQDSKNQNKDDDNT